MAGQRVEYNQQLPEFLRPPDRRRTVGLDILQTHPTTLYKVDGKQLAATFALTCGDGGLSAFLVSNDTHTASLPTPQTGSQWRIGAENVRMLPKGNTLNIAGESLTCLAEFTGVFENLADSPMLLHRTPGATGALLDTLQVRFVASRPHPVATTSNAKNRQEQLARNIEKEETACVLTVKQFLLGLQNLYYPGLLNDGTHCCFLPIFAKDGKLIKLLAIEEPVAGNTATYADKKVPLIRVSGVLNDIFNLLEQAEIALPEQAYTTRTPEEVKDWWHTEQEAIKLATLGPTVEQKLSLVQRLQRMWQEFSYELTTAKGPAPETYFDEPFPEEWVKTRKQFFTPAEVPALARQLSTVALDNEVSTKQLGLSSKEYQEELTRVQNLIEGKTNESPISIARQLTLGRACTADMLLGDPMCRLLKPTEAQIEQDLGIIDQPLWYYQVTERGINLVTEYHKSLPLSEFAGYERIEFHVDDFGSDSSRIQLSRVGLSANHQATEILVTRVVTLMANQDGTAASRRRLQEMERLFLGSIEDLWYDHTELVEGAMYLYEPRRTYIIRGGKKFHTLKEAGHIGAEREHMEVCVLLPASLKPSQHVHFSNDLLDESGHDADNYPWYYIDERPVMSGRYTQSKEEWERKRKEKIAYNTR